MKKLAAPRAIAPLSEARKKTGRPAYVPTPEDREIVVIMRGNGVETATIARLMGIGLSTLERHYAEELREAHKLLVARMGHVLTRAGLDGNVNAAVRWLIMKGGWHFPKGALNPEDAVDADVVHYFLPPNHRDRPEPDEAMPAPVVIEHAPLEQPALEAAPHVDINMTPPRPPGYQPQSWSPPPAPAKPARPRHVERTPAEQREISEAKALASWRALGS